MPARRKWLDRAFFFFFVRVFVPFILLCWAPVYTFWVLSGCIIRGNTEGRHAGSVFVLFFFLRISFVLGHQSTPVGMEVAAPAGVPQKGGHTGVFFTPEYLFYIFGPYFGQLHENADGRINFHHCY